MKFGGEVQHPTLLSNVSRGFVEPQFTDGNSVLFAVFHILLKHVRQSEFEFEGYASAHHAVAVNGVYESLELAGKDIARLDGDGGLCGYVSRQSGTSTHFPNRILHQP